MRKLLFGAFTLWSSVALAGKHDRVPSVVEDALAYAETDRDKAARLLEDALANTNGLADADRAIIEVHAGEQRRLLDQDPAAAAHFQAVVALGDTSQADAAALGLILLDANDGVDPALLVRLAAVPEKTVLPTENADRYLILATAAARANDAPSTRELSKKALSWAKEDPSVLADVRASLQALVATDGSVPPPVADTSTALQKAERAFDEGRIPDAQRYAQQAIEASPAESDDALVAKYLLRRIDAVPVDSAKIGVMLPLSGSFEAAGKQIQEAIELGYGTAAAKRKLVFVDSGETADSAIAALEKLVLEDGVVAVVGPLRTDGAVEVARAANALRVPLIGLSQVGGTTTDHPWVFQGGVTVPDQVGGLLDYAMGKRAMTKFAVFAPDSPYGHSAADAFTAGVTARGGVITASAFYDAAATDETEFARQLARIDASARSSELARLRAEAVAKGGNPDTVVLPPVLDMDAIFVPDNASRVPFACAGLAYREFPIGEFKPTKTSRSVPLMGLSGWNKDSLVAAGNQYVRGSMFTDAYHTSESSAAFEARYQAATNRTPSSLEAVAVDVGGLLASASASPATTRAAFRDAIAAATYPTAVTGADGFDPVTRNAHHHVRVLTINSRAIVAIDE
jgi:ABC-type branched-subunit amino acid transport system substrate-binding protein